MLSDFYRTGGKFLFYWSFKLKGQVVELERENKKLYIVSPSVTFRLYKVCFFNNNQMSLLK